MLTFTHSQSDRQTVIFLQSKSLPHSLFFPLSLEPRPFSDELACDGYYDDFVLYDRFPVYLLVRFS